MTWDKVVICDVWGPGKSHLTPPLGGNLEFRLVRRPIRGKDGESYPANYAVEFVDGHAPAEWAGAIFTPMGTEDVKGISGLPDWDPSKPPVKKYQDVINAAASDLARSSTRRLETIVPYVDNSGNVGYSAVRLFRVENARQAPTTHLFVIEAVTVAQSAGGVRALQDGVGHGPPE